MVDTIEYTAGVDRKVRNRVQLSQDSILKEVQVKEQVIEILEGPYVHVDIDVAHDSHLKSESITFTDQSKAKAHAKLVMANLGYPAVMYETVGGIRILIDSMVLPGSPVAQQIFKRFDGDKSYLELATNLGVYPVRVSPKPYRDEPKVAVKVWSAYLELASKAFLDYVALHDRLAQV